MPKGGLTHTPARTHAHTFFNRFFVDFCMSFQEPPKSGQERPKSGQERPKSDPRAPKTGPRAAKSDQKQSKSGQKRSMSKKRRKKHARSTQHSKQKALESMQGAHGKANEKRLNIPLSVHSWVRCNYAPTNHRGRHAEIFWLSWEAYLCVCMPFWGCLRPRAA